MPRYCGNCEMSATPAGSCIYGEMQSHHSVFCLAPHSLHVYGTRTYPGAAKTRFGAPHFPHLASIRVLPCLTAMAFRSKASFTIRSVSSRIDCFDISRLLPCCKQVLHVIADIDNELVGRLFPVASAKPAAVRAIGRELTCGAAGSRRLAIPRLPRCGSHSI